MTALCPYIGYKKSAELAKEALRTNTPIKKLVLSKKLMSPKKLDEVLEPFAMTVPNTSNIKAFAV